MSTQPDPASESASTSEPGGSWSGNGTHDGTTATAVAAPDAEVTDAESTESTEATAATDETAATTDAGEAIGSAEETVASADDAVASGDEAVAAAGPEVVDAAQAETEAAAEAAAEQATTPASPDAAGDFLSELVRAMRTTVGAERTRIAADIERRRTEHLAAIQARRESEAQKMHQLASDDLKAIDDWAGEERQRIERERERRATELSDDLKKSLAEHGSRIDREVEGVEAAIAAHRVEVDAFFADLDRESDPVGIAQRAGNRPVFPALGTPGESSATAPSGDAAPTTPVAVMDASSGAKAGTPFGWNRSSSPATESSSGVPDVLADAEAPAAGDATGGAGDATGAAAAADTILHAVPSGRPLGWLRRNNDSADHPNS